MPENISKGHTSECSCDCRYEQVSCTIYFINGEKIKNVQSQVRKRKFLMNSSS